MKLYFSPGACSLSPHIVLREAGIPFELERVHGPTKKTASGGDFRAINAKGYIPAVILDDGALLTEGATIVQYFADLKPESKLAPAAGTFERVRLQEWLTYISTEIHKGFGPLFSPKAPEEWKSVCRENLAAKLDFLSTSLSDKTFLMGDTFTVADAYLFTVLQWTKFTGIDLTTWPKLKAYSDRIAARPAVKAAIEAEQAS